MSSDLTLHPDVTSLHEQVDALERELARALAEAEELTKVTGPGLLLQYQLKLGAVELAALEAEVRFRRARRAVELVRAALARGLAPSVITIETELEKELVEWHRRVEEAALKIKSAQQWSAGAAITGEDYKELQHLFRGLVLRLHPDLHGELSPSNHQLWHRVQEAYVARDLTAIRDLTTIVGGSEAATPDEDTFTALERKQLRLAERLTQVLADLERIRVTPPLDLSSHLADPAWVLGRRQEAEQRTHDLDAARQDLELELNLLLKGRDVRGFGSN